MKYKIIFISVFSASLSADPQWCSGNITNTWINNHGSVLINGTWRGDHTQICNLNGTWEGVTVETCKGWLSLAQVAQASKSGVKIYYNDVLSCAEIPTYANSPNPGYIMLTE